MTLHPTYRPSNGFIWLLIVCFVGVLSSCQQNDNVAQQSITPPLAKGISADGWIIADFSTTLGSSRAGDVVVIKGHLPKLPAFDTGGTPAVGQVALEPPMEWKLDVGAFE